MEDGCCELRPQQPSSIWKGFEPVKNVVLELKASYGVYNKVFPWLMLPCRSNVFSARVQTLLKVDECIFGSVHTTQRFHAVRRGAMTYWGHRPLRRSLSSEIANDVRQKPDENTDIDNDIYFFGDNYGNYYYKSYHTYYCCYRF